MLYFSGCNVSQGQEKEAAPFRVMFWNVENYFDTQHDTLKNDYEFLPRGVRYWTRKRFEAKRNQIYKTIVALGEAGGEPYSEALIPAIVGLAEVENDGVLRELCQGTPLAKYHYQSVHYESPDARGIDVALLYRPQYFRVLESRSLCVSDTSQGFRTRDILLVFGVSASGDSLVLFVCHFPSKRGGKEADVRRAKVARYLMQQMSSAIREHPTAVVLAMGDFNATPKEMAAYVPYGFVNLMDRLPTHEGSYFYQGRWSYIDQFFVSGNTLEEGKRDEGSCPLRLEGNNANIFHLRPLLTEDKGNMDLKPRRTFQGPKYYGGVSDHLPIYLTLQRM